MSQEPYLPSRVGVVVVTWNSASTIEACLASIPAGVPVVVVDNGSSDDTRERVRKTGATLLTPERNLGFGTACNRGASSLEGRDLLLLNPDALLAAGSLESLVSVMDADPQVGVVGPAIRGDDDGYELSWGSDPTLLAEWRRQRDHRRRVVIPTEATRVDWVTGGCCLVRRSAWDAVGGFDERFFLYFEDLDLCRRIRGAGFHVRFEPRAEAAHSRGVSSKQIGNLVELYYRSSQLLYYRLHRGALMQGGLRAYLALKYLSRFWKSPYYPQIVALALAGRSLRSGDRPNA